MRVGRHTKGNLYLEKDFIAYLQSKDLAPSTQDAYCLSAYKFCQWYEQDVFNCTKKDVLKYLEHLQNNRQQENITRRNALTAINHYFAFLQKIGTAEQNPTSLIEIRGTHKRHLYKIYTPEELTQLFDNYYHTYIRNFQDFCYAPKLGGIQVHNREQALLARQRNYAMLGLLVYQGLHTNELQKITINDIDLKKAKVKVAGGKKSNTKNIPLNASQIGFLINYIERIRPQFFTWCEESEALFFPLPECGKRKTKSTNLMGTLKALTAQVKSIDKSLQNFKQVRASVITHWLKTEGLRRAQYYAGHRYISSTEKYLPNQIEGLIDDITKYNPF